MKEEELMKKLEKVELPKIELESHRRRLRMALLDSDYFKKRQEVTFMELVKARTRGVMDTIWSGLVARRPVWQVALASTLVVIVTAAVIVGLPSTSPGLSPATVIPGGTTATTVIGGAPLTDAEKEKALDIVRADPEVRGLLNRGAVIDNVLPVSAHFEGINPETGEAEEITETWAQVWIKLGDKEWGALVDLVRGKVENLTD